MRLEMPVMAHSCSTGSAFPPHSLMRVHPFLTISAPTANKASLSKLTFFVDFGAFTCNNSTFMKVTAFFEFRRIGVQPFAALLFTQFTL